jgi:mono/diheme cytochrome c family protein
MELMRSFAGMRNGAKLAMGAAVLLAGAIPAAAAFANAADPTAKLTAEQVDQGRALFNDWSCGACHTLADAKGSGQIGPALDGNANLDYGFTSDRITNGQGAMPSFGGQMTDDEIDVVTKYILQAKK